MKILIALFVLFCLTAKLSVIKGEEPVKVGAYPPNTTLCYKDIGCFTNNPPFNNTQGYLPEDPDYVNATFVMYTPKTKTDGRVITYNNLETIRNSYFDKSLPLKIVIHGFFNNFDTPWLHNLKDSLLTFKTNVIIVGWGNGAKFPLYNNASSNTRLVGRELSIILANITSLFYPNDSKNFKIHCIGHSLGSHVCGYAGHYSKMNNVFFERISGMDPAGPFFEDTNELVRLDTGDARFVDAYHTNAGVLINLRFGIIAPIGHVDFYLNGGSSQPGCGFTEVSCSHGRAIDYFTESITSPCTLLGFKCKNESDLISGSCGLSDGFAVAGYFADTKVHGSFYANTRSSAPFCGNQYVISFKIGSEKPDSTKANTAGEIIFKIDDESFLLTSIDTVIEYGSEIVKYIVAIPDIAATKTLSITFNKKPKALWDFGKDKWGPGFFYEQLKVVNLMNDETVYMCERKLVLDKQINEHILTATKC